MEGRSSACSPALSPKARECPTPTFTKRGCIKECELCGAEDKPYADRSDTWGDRQPTAIHTPVLLMGELAATCLAV